MKTAFIEIIPMLTRINQNAVCYVCIYGAFSLIYFARLVFATLVYCSNHLCLSTFKFSEAEAFH